MIDTSRLDKKKHAHLIEIAEKFNESIKGEGASHNLHIDEKTLKRQIAVASAMNRYIQPKSVTWNAMALLPIVAGVGIAIGDQFNELSWLSSLIRTVVPEYINQSPSALIWFGLAATGVLGKVKGKGL